MNVWGFLWHDWIDSEFITLPTTFREFAVTVGSFSTDTPFYDPIPIILMRDSFDVLDDVKQRFRKAKFEQGVFPSELKYARVVFN